MSDTQTSCINIQPMPTHCPQCGAEYRHIQHPMKPLGVIMRSECDCKLVAETVRVGDNSVTTMTLVPPEK